VSAGRYWLETLGCPKNRVDSDKLAGVLAAEGFVPAGTPQDAGLVVVNTCAFIEAAREESIETILQLAESRRPGAKLVVTGCLAERYGDELARALPEVDLIAGFGDRLVPHDVPIPTPVHLGRRADAQTDVRTDGHGSFDLLELPRPPASAPWAYVKVAEGCDRICGFCAIPSFRGPQRSRSSDAILAEVAALADGSAGDDPPTWPVREVVLVAQDLASFGRDRSRGARRAGGDQPIVDLVRAISELVARTRLLYLYPSGLTDDLVQAVLDTGVPYFDLSLQHVSRRHLAAMRRWGDGERFLQRVEEIRRADPAATFRSSFILGYPGETEEDHDQLLDFLRTARLDWAGFFVFSPEAGTHAVTLPRAVPPALAMERLRECTELQDEITARRREALVGETVEVLVDAPGVGRTVREAPEIDGVVRLPRSLAPGSLVDLLVTEAEGPDLSARPVTALADPAQPSVVSPVSGVPA